MTHVVDGTDARMVQPGERSPSVRRPTHPARSTVLFLVALTLAGAPLAAQGVTAGPSGGSGLTVSGSLRTRVESWDWFGRDANGEYTYPGSLLRLAFGQSNRKADWQLEFAVTFILGLPDHAIGPGAQGSLGLGANYFGANDGSRNAAAIFVKQAFVRFKKLGGVDGQSLRIGRIEFVDGS